MNSEALVRLLRLELECQNYAANTIREYTRLAGLFFDEHPAGVAALTRERVARWFGLGEQGLFCRERHRRRVGWPRSC